MPAHTSFSRLTVQLILTLLLAAVLTTTTLVLLFAPVYPASASNLPAIHASRQADYRPDNIPPVFAPLNPRAIDLTLP
jgi:hypothetical protein